MGSPYLSEIRIMSFNFAPKGWALCNGQTLPINQNQALFSLLGTMYGGNGQTTFQLPNLRGRVPIHLGGGFIEGEAAGQESHTLTISELAPHTHQLNASATNADVVTPGGNVLAQSSQLYGPPAQLTTLDPSTDGAVGGSQAHPNMQPYLVLNFCICLQGIFPARN
jgi:microcystin-dependent protein